MFSRRAGPLAGRRMGSPGHFRLMADRHAGLEPFSECSDRRFQNSFSRPWNPDGTRADHGISLHLPPGRRRNFTSQHAAVGKIPGFRRARLSNPNPLRTPPGALCGRQTAEDSCGMAENDTGVLSETPPPAHDRHNLRHAPTAGHFLHNGTGQPEMERLSLPASEWRKAERIRPLRSGTALAVHPGGKPAHSPRSCGKHGVSRRPGRRRNRRLDRSGAGERYGRAEAGETLLCRHRFPDRESGGQRGERLSGAVPHADEVSADGRGSRSGSGKFPVSVSASRHGMDAAIRRKIRDAPRPLPRRPQ